MKTTEIATFETFKKIDNYQINTLSRNNPTCFNGNVSIIKYKITIEKIEESDEIYIERITKLWENCDNFHHFNSLKSVAERFGLELNHKTFGKNTKNKYK